MKLTWRQCQALVARCLHRILVDGTMKAFGVIMEETVDTFQAQHYLIGCAFTLKTGIGYLIAPLASLFDGTVHPRIVASFGGFLAGLGFIGRAFLQSKEVWQLFACLSVSGVGFGLVNIITVISMNEAFESTYSTAYSMTLLTTYIGVSVMPPFLEYLQREYGEQTSMVVFGILSWTLVLSGLFTPSGKRDSEDEIEMTGLDASQTDKIGSGTQGTQTRSYNADYEGSWNATTATEDCTEESNLIKHAAATTKERHENIKIGEREKREKPEETIVARTGMKSWILIARNHPECLLMLFLTFLDHHGFASWSIFLVPYGEYLGLHSSTAVWLSTLGGIAGFVGRFSCVVLFYFHRMNLFLGLLMPTLCVALAYVTSLFTSSFFALAVVSSLSGFGLSVHTCVIPSWIPSSVCDYNFKTVIYAYYVIAGISQLIGGLTTGGITDVSGSYRVSFASLAMLSFIQASVVLVWLFCPSVPSPGKSPSSGKHGNTNCCEGK